MTILSVLMPKKNYPVSKTSVQVIASINLSEIDFDSELIISAEGGFTTPQLMAGGYNTLVGTRLIFADTAVNTLGTLVAPGIGENVTPQIHHIIVSRTVLARWSRVDRPYLNWIAWFDASRAKVGDKITMDLARLQVLVIA